MESKTSRLEQAREVYASAVDAIPDDRWNGPTLCSGWTPSNVVAHVTTGDQLFRAVIFDALGRDRSGLDVPMDFADRQRRAQAMAAWEPGRLKEASKRESKETVATVLDVVETHPGIIVKVPFGDVPMTVVRALRLNEYIIHGHDLSPAVGENVAAPAWFIDHGLGDAIVMLKRLHQRSAHKGKTASFHVHRTDGDGEWTVKAENGQAEVEPGHHKADVAFRGTGESLYWLLMGRGTAVELDVEILGDQALGRAFKEWFPGP